MERALLARLVADGLVLLYRQYDRPVVIRLYLERELVVLYGQCVLTSRDPVLGEPVVCVEVAWIESDRALEGALRLIFVAVKQQRIAAFDVCVGEIRRDLDSSLARSQRIG